MSEVVAKSVISLELDTSHLQYDATRAELIYGQLFDRLQHAANIQLRFDQNSNGKSVIKLDVDPKTTTAGMEVIRKIVKDYTARLNREARVTVGVDEKSVGYLRYSFQRLKSSIVDGVGQGIGQAFVFTITRGIERAIIGAAKAPFKFLSASLLAYRTQEAAELKLGKAIEATGGQVRKTQADILKTAKELEKLTGTADTTIISMQGILAAAKGLSGEGFDRATKAALDLAEVLGGDPVNKAEKLAKALQEPEKALEMLRDEGVAFTKTQQDVVKYFVKVNDLASAQGIILDAIESKYYGASDATGTHADEMARLANEYDSLLETMGAVISQTDGAFIPALETGLAALDAYTPAIAGTANALIELAAAMLDYSIEGDRANLTTEEAIQKASEFSSALKAVGKPASIWGYLRSNVLRGAQGAGEAFGGLPGSPADKFTQKMKEQAEAAEKVIDDAAAAEEEKAIKFREDRKKRLEEEAAQRRADADKRRADAEKRLAEAAILAKKDHDQEEEAKLKKKRLKKEEADDNKRLREEERARLKAQQDFEKSMGRDSLVGLHQRIQDAMYLRREEAKKQKQDTVADAPAKGGPSFAPEDPEKWSIPWVKQQEAKAKKKQEQEEQAIKDRDKREARFKANEAAAITMKGKEEQAAKEAVKVAEDNAKLQEEKAAAVLEGLKAERKQEELNNASIKASENAKRIKEEDNAAREETARRRKEIDANPLNQEQIFKDIDELREGFAQGKKSREARKERLAEEDAKIKELADSAYRLKHPDTRDAEAARIANREAAKKKAEEEETKAAAARQKAMEEHAREVERTREARKKADESRTPEQRENLDRMLNSFPPLTSARQPGKRRPSFAPEGNTPSFAPETGDIKVTVKPEQKEVVSSITAQTKALSKAITESRKLT